MSAPDAATCTDREWSAYADMCGCGIDHHHGRLCDLIYSPWMDGILDKGGVCDACPTRHEQGLHDDGGCKCEASR